MSSHQQQDSLQQPQQFNGLSNALSSAAVAQPNNNNPQIIMKDETSALSNGGLGQAQLQMPMQHQQQQQQQSLQHQNQQQKQQMIQHQQQMHQQFQQQQHYQQNQGNMQQLQQHQQLTYHQQMQQQQQHQQQMLMHQQHQQQPQHQQFQPQQAPIVSAPQMMGFQSRGNRGLSKKKLSPFLVFVKHRRPLLEQERPDIQMKEILQQVGQEWHRLTEDQKQIYRDQSERDKIIADQQLGIITQPSKGRGKQNNGGNVLGIGPNGQPIQVKKALTPYMCFLKEQKHLLSQQHGEIVMKEFVRLGAQKWQSMNEEEKEPYKRLADVDRVRHEREKQNVLMNGNGNHNDGELQLAQMHLAQKAAQNYRPQLHLQNIDTVVQQPQSTSRSNANGGIPHIQTQQQNPKITQQIQMLQKNLHAVMKQLETLEKTKPRQPNSALFYFDQEKRQDILSSADCRTAEEAFDLIRTRFEQAPPSDKQRYEQLVNLDVLRYQREEQEYIQHRDKLIQTKTQLETHIKQMLSMPNSRIQLQQQSLIGQPQNIMSHPFVVQLQQVIQNQQSLLVQQATLIQNIMNTLKQNNIQLERLPGFQSVTNSLNNALEQRQQYQQRCGQQDQDAKDNDNNEVNGHDSTHHSSHHEQAEQEVQQNQNFDGPQVQGDLSGQHYPHQEENQFQQNYEDQNQIQHIPDQLCEQQIPLENHEQLHQNLDEETMLQQADEQIRQEEVIYTQQQQFQLIQRRFSAQKEQLKALSSQIPMLQAVVDNTEQLQIQDLDQQEERDVDMKECDEDQRLMINQQEDIQYHNTDVQQLNQQVVEVSQKQPEQVQIQQQNISQQEEDQQQELQLQDDDDEEMQEDQVNNQEDQKQTENNEEQIQQLGNTEVIEINKCQLLPLPEEEEEVNDKKLVNTPIEQADEEMNDEVDDGEILDLSNIKPQEDINTNRSQLPTRQKNQAKVNSLTEPDQSQTQKLQKAKQTKRLRQTQEEFEISQSIHNSESQELSEQIQQLKPQKKLTINNTTRVSSSNSISSKSKPINKTIKNPTCSKSRSKVIVSQVTDQDNILSENSGEEECSEFIINSSSQKAKSKKKAIKQPSQKTLSNKKKVRRSVRDDDDAEYKVRNRKSRAAVNKQFDQTQSDEDQEYDENNDREITKVRAKTRSGKKNQMNDKNDDEDQDRELKDQQKPTADNEEMGSDEDEE
eukprot:403367255